MLNAEFLRLLTQIKQIDLYYILTSNLIIMVILIEFLDLKFNPLLNEWDDFLYLTWYVKPSILHSWYI